MHTCRTDQKVALPCASQWWNLKYSLPHTMSGRKQISWECSVETESLGDGDLFFCHGYHVTSVSTILGIFSEIGFPVKMFVCLLSSNGFLLRFTCRIQDANVFLVFFNMQVNPSLWLQLFLFIALLGQNPTTTWMPCHKNCNQSRTLMSSQNWWILIKYKNKNSETPLWSRYVMTFCTNLCQAPYCEWVWREEDDSSSHPTNPRGSAARCVRLFVRGSPPVSSLLVSVALVWSRSKMQVCIDWRKMCVTNWCDQLFKVNLIW